MRTFKNSESGVALLELAMILPVLLLSSVALLELSFMFQRMQVAGMLSQAAIRLARGECEALPLEDKTPCIEQSSTNLLAMMPDSNAGGITIKLSLFELVEIEDPLDPSQSIATTYTAISSAGDNYFATLTVRDEIQGEPYIHYSRGDVSFSPGKQDAELRTPRPTIWVVETLVPVISITDNALGIDRLFPQGGLYSVTII